MNHSGAPMERAEVSAVAELARTQVVVVGGGINGIATFRDLALQGVDVVLVERNDFASGASAASSHMIHGGIRYLEYGEFRLVRESVRERNDLLRTAPHLVHPLETTIPIYSLFSGLLSAPLRFLLRRAGKPKERGALLVKVGLVFYDLFSRGGREVPRHKFAGRRQTLRELPSLDTNVRFSATYYDAGVADPERLALDVLLDGARANPGAHALNYAEAVGLSNGSVRIRDRETGREFDIGADLVVNASGPWADLTGATLGLPSKFLGGTKGSHIVLDSPELLAATGGREIFFEHDDGRIVLIYPIRDRVLIGTSDIEADPAEPAICTEDEVDYFLGLVGSMFPLTPIDRSVIVYRYSGIRPLPRHDGESPGAVSRDYVIEETPADSGRPPVLTLVGGKWTTFRALGETLSNRALALLERERLVKTLALSIGGGVDYPCEADSAAWMEKNLRAVAHDRRPLLLSRYGTRSREVASSIEATDDRILAGGQLSTGEIAYLAKCERVIHLADLVFRRTDLAFSGRANRAVLEEVAPVLAEALKWDDITLDREIEQCMRLLDSHGAPTEVGAMLL